MSLQDKIASAKPSTFLTDGLSEEEVKQAVDEGRKSVTETVKLIIEIPKVPKNDHERWVLSRGIPLDDIDSDETRAYFDGQAYGWEEGRKALIEDIKAEIKTFTITEKSEHDTGFNDGVLKCFNALDNIDKENDTWT